MHLVVAAGTQASEDCEWLSRYSGCSETAARAAHLRYFRNGRIERRRQGRMNRSRSRLEIEIDCVLCKMQHVLPRNAAVPASAAHSW